MISKGSLGNPFSGYGAIVCGKDFIGRAAAIQTITERIIEAKEPGCIAIIGLPRIGKSSLAWHTLIDSRDKLLQQQKLAIWINMGVFRTPEEFFRHIIISTLDTLDDASILTETIKALAEQALFPGLAWIDFQDHLQRFIKGIRRLGWRLIFIIDEFDAARSVFRDNLFAYQYLRELHNNPNNRICYVTTSRRTIPEIEFSADISNLNGIFHPLYLGMFSDHEFTEHFAKLQELGIMLDEKSLHQIKLLTGLHPYLNAVIGFQIADQFIRENRIDLEDASKGIFQSYYDHLVSDHLRQENLLGRLLEIAKTPVLDSELGPLEKFKMLGLIKVADNRCITMFSESFHDYLTGLEKPIQDIHIFTKGQLLEDRYRVLRVFSTTNHSQVAEAWDESLERKVAIKCLYLSQGSKEIIQQLKNNLEREGKILAGLQHSNIGLVYDIIEEPVGIVMEWIEGRSIQNYINSNIKFEIADVIRIGIIIADALSHAHSHGIIHRDVKPSNIIVNASNEPVLIDFDIARVVNLETISVNKKDGKYARLGTARYSAPEQFTEPERITSAVDIFSLGMVLYELLTHETPWGLGSDPYIYDEDKVPPPEQKNIPNNLYIVLCQMLNQNPKSRPEPIVLKTLLHDCL